MVSRVQSMDNGHDGVSGNMFTRMSLPNIYAAFESGHDHTPAEGMQSYPYNTRTHVLCSAYESMSTKIHRPCFISFYALT